MLHAYRETGGTLVRMAPDEGLEGAIWIDLWRPLPAQVEAVAALGLDVPTREDMEEIELSSRLYREDGLDYMTIVLPGLLPDGEQVSGPVTFILGPTRLVTVRYHAPRPFETYPARAAKVGPGCAAPDRLFLGLTDEIVGRLADHLETAGRGLDEVARISTDISVSQRSDVLEGALARVGIEGERIARVRLALLTLERMLGFFALEQGASKSGTGLKGVIKGLMRDIQALEVHADFLSSRVGLATDTVLGMINLSQNATVRIVSVVAVLFLPPTLIASIYGMNFEVMPELAQTWGYPAALALMAASAGGTYAYFKWKGWL